MNAGQPPARAIGQIVEAVIASELRRLRAEGIGQHSDAARTAHDLTAPLALDSLETMGVAAALSETFGQNDITFAPDTPATARAWADRIATRSIETLSVQTSGSTGVPQRHVHPVSTLLNEADEFARRVAGTRRIIALVPADHLYGLVWTALLPPALNVPVHVATLAQMPAPQTGDLVVGVPEQWAALARFRRQWPPKVIGVSSAGVLADTTAEALRAAGLSRLLDVYGSAETSAIGLREAPEAGYTLLPRWQLAGDDAPAMLVDSDGRRVTPPDRIRAIDARRVERLGRHDHAVAIGGVNVYPERVAAVLAEHEAVAEARVRLGRNGRLKAFVVPVTTTDETALEALLQRFAGQRLTPPERPTRFRFGARLPRNAMGKLADWD